MTAGIKRSPDTLREQTAVENANDIETQVVGAARLRSYEPALSDRFLEAEVCRVEPKMVRSPPDQPSSPQPGVPAA